MEQKALIQALGFIPKEATTGVFHKQYAKAGGYTIEVDFDNQLIDFGSRIKGESKTTQNFSQAENWVVLECVDRLLEKGYRPGDITLEKVFPSGHGHSGRLDVFVQKDGKAFLMIECKTYGKEYEKELKAIHKNGGQLFTYFQNDTNTQYLMLYASQLRGKNIEARWDIVKIEDHYRSAGNVADFYDRWSKVTYQNGIFEDWVAAYDFKNKLLTKKELLPLKETDSEAIFHGFMSILRKHSVSDEPNAFNKIFNLFLAKIYDEKKRETDELEFQWREKQDDPVEFQVRLINLYQKGMYEFLRKEVEGISDQDFTYKTTEELHEKKKKWLMFNNVFAIKEVIDSESFDDNHRVLKEVVELLHKYQIRYPRRQAHLSDFFERLLTTGLKQKAGQYFSPPPVTRFIVKSLPIRELIREELKGETAKLPAVIDYAVGSGHFITEIMEEYQSIIDHDIDTTHLYPDVIADVEGWQRKKYDWAARYIYGIEKDYRLVKVAKVGCYFYGDGLAQIIHGDGLDSFRDSKSFVGRLKKVDTSEQEKFSIVVSNPPYSVEAFKGDLKNKNADKDFELYPLLTDKSSEIECLFVERTKQLLKDGGLAVVILPSSILSNAGNLHTRTREIILQHFELVAITEFGGNTFMATNTSTVTLFMRRKHRPLDVIRQYCADAISDGKDMTINGLEHALSSFVSHVWDEVSLDDYRTLLKKEPNDAIQAHDNYKEYRKKIKVKDEADFWDILLRREEEKLYYFVLAADQKVVLVKSGEKEKEKDFLGYEFSERRRKEGMFAREKGKTVDECTLMYSIEDQHETKAAWYVNQAFKGIFDLEVSAVLAPHVSYIQLADMLKFERAEFDKSIATSAKRKILLDSKWKQVKLEEIATMIQRGKSPVYGNSKIQIIKSGQARGYKEFDFTEKYFVSEGFILDERKLEKGDILINSSGVGTAGRVTIFDLEGDFVVDSHITILRPDQQKVYPDYLIQVLASIGFRTLEGLATGQSGQIELSISTIQNLRVPLPSIEKQREFVKIINQLEIQERKASLRVENIRNEFTNRANDLYDNYPLRSLGSLSGPPIYGANESAVKGDPSTDYRYIRITDINENGKLNNDWKTSKNVEDKYVLKDGDFLFARSGATAGKTFLYKEKYGKALYAGYLIKFPLDKSKINADFLNFALKADHYLSWIMTKRTGTAQPNINAQEFSGFEIPTPSISEQQKIVAEIEHAEEQIAKLEQELAGIAAQKQKVLSDFLQ